MSTRTAAMRLAALTATALVLGASGCGGEAGAQPKTPAGAAGASASDFAGRDLEGKSVRLSSHLGKDAVLLNFWATWCEPCVAEFPHLRQLYEANKAKGLVVLGVAMDGPETVANVQAFAKRNQISFPIVLDEDSQIAAIYNPKKSAPLSILIDKTGRIAAIREGYNPGDEIYLAQDVAKVLDGASVAK